MNRLIRDLLDVAQIEARRLSLERVRVSPAQLASDAVEAQRLLICLTIPTAPASAQRPQRQLHA